MRTWNWRLGLVGLASLGCCALACGAESEPERLLRSHLRNGQGVPACKGTMTGEGACWQSAYKIGEYVSKYRTTQDTAWLDAGVRYFDTLVGKMHTAPDGYKGWVGPYIYDPKYICDVHVGDAILANGLLGFAELVLKGTNEELRVRYGAKATAYVDLVAKHVIEKWDRRGTWREDGPIGAYVSWDQYMTPEDLTAWRPLRVQKSTMTLPFNKNMDLGKVALALYRITGEPAFRDKALKVFNFTKSRMALFEDHYVWSYWEPFGPWDVKTNAPNELVHWVNVHPYRDYQAGEVGAIVEAYHSGLTFTAEDMRRLVNTNLKAMWNGDRAHPKWANSNAAVERAALGAAPKRQVPEGGHFDHLAGCCWGALARFDATLAELAGRPLKAPPDCARRHAELPVTEFDVPFHSNCRLTMACLLPRVVERGGWTYVASKSRTPGAIEIALYGADGATRLADILATDSTGGTDGREGLLIHKWELGNTPPGEYRVRWTLAGEYREYPLTVR